MSVGELALRVAIAFVAVSTLAFLVGMFASLWMAGEVDCENDDKFDK